MDAPAGAAAHSAPARTVPRSRNGSPTHRLLAARIDPPSCASTPASDDAASDDAAPRAATRHAPDCALRLTASDDAAPRAARIDAPSCASAYRERRRGPARIDAPRPELRLDSREILQR